MRKRWMILFSVIILIGILIIIILICGKENSNSADVGDIDVGDVDVGNIEVKSNDKKIEEIVKEKYTFYDMQNIKKFMAQNNVGNISVEVSENDNLQIETESMITVYTKKDLERIKENIKIQENLETDICKIGIISKESGEELWEWLEKNIEDYNVSVDLNIKIPQNMNEITLEAECGNIKVNGLEGSLNIKGKVGNIVANQCQLMENCILQTRTGNISILLCDDLMNDAFVDMVTKTGNIEINLAGNAIEYTEKKEDLIEGTIDKKYDINANVRTGLVKVVK